MSFKKNLVISIIPAKSFSRSIKNKNLQKIGKKTLVEITIQASKKCKIIDQTYVTSDSKKILDIAKDNNAISVLRPKKFCKNNSTANDVVSHFVKTLSDKIIKKNPYIVYLQPTSPLRKAKHINASFEILKNTKKNKLVSVTLASSTILKSYLQNKNKLELIHSRNLANHNRQSLPKVFMPNGAIYIFRIKEFLKKKTFPQNDLVPLIMSLKDSLDIDYIKDLNKVRKIIARV